MKLILVSALSMLFASSIVAQKTPHHKALNSRSDTVDVLNYQINLDMTDMNNQQISGNCVVTFTPKINGVTQLDLDLQSLTVDSIISNNSTLVFTHNDTLINITLPTSLNTTDTSDVTVYYHGSPQMDPSGWGGFYFSGGYAFNLGVGFQDDPHNYGRVWFPCFDNFVERSTYEFNIITNAGRTAHCNGELMSETVIQGDTITRQWVLNEEIPTYLACIAVADYETVHQTFFGVNDTVPVELVGVASDTTNLKNSFVNLNGAFDAYEQCYGPYMWNKVGFSLVPFSSGAMEHATNVAYPRAAANGGLGFETLMAHEFSHHWWGDLITCETAEDMWINEGMAVYSEHLFLEKIYDYETSLVEIKNNHKEVVQFTHLNEGGFRAISGIPHQYTYGEHVYNKGASVAHNMRAYLGDSLFFHGLQSVLNTFQWQSVNSGQFRDELTNSTGVDMTNFFKDWVFAPGFSHFDIDSMDVVPNGPNYDVTIYIQQKLRGATVYHTGTPLEVSFYDANWNKHLDTIVVSGQYDNVTVSVPFPPLSTILNEANKLNQARTDDQVIVNGTFANNNLLLALVNSLTITSVNDSALLQFEHHWVAPDSIKNNVNNYRISTSRYWSIDGILPAGLSGSLRFVFDGRSGSGFLDVDLVPVNGDSLILLYRESAADDWTEYPYYTKTTVGPTIPFGWMLVDSLLLGEYTFANSASAIGIAENTIQKDQVKIYPNPSDSFVWLEPLGNSSEEFLIELYDLNGKKVKETNFSSRKKMNVAELKAGNYIALIFQNGTVVQTEKLMLK